MERSIGGRQRHLERFKILVLGNGRQLLNGNAYEIKAASLMFFKCFNRRDPDCIRRFFAVLDAPGYGRCFADENRVSNRLGRPGGVVQRL